MPWYELWLLLTLASLVVPWSHAVTALRAWIAIVLPQLALRHRPNKNGAQRIVSFVGSPVADDERTLKRLADVLRKNTVRPASCLVVWFSGCCSDNVQHLASQINVDIIAIGENAVNEGKLQAFVDTINKDGSGRYNDSLPLRYPAVLSNHHAVVVAVPYPCSHLVCVPSGMLPSDVLLTSPIIQGEGGASVSHFAEFGGVDPSLDPELAAVRLLRCPACLLLPACCALIVPCCQSNVCPGAACVYGGNPCCDGCW